ncbi:DNA-binding protein [Thalassotalea profundi]|uniref:KfrA N-terminal DNA-binding domain-containing protein n=1 Tax=Thalassotalea profundi TaxID=2036687 RepID=A0ABQ3J026_9GAMM|nr:DNA-binding protein [Thalassotalea profundi]GHE96741.1 hypothetical protein GCM10011501_27800 [Thalassotalea profundi]
MAKAKVTDEQIIQVGSELQKADKNVTGHALCKVLGGRPDRLIEVWEKHLLESNSDENSLQYIQLSAGLEELFQSMSNDILKSIKSVLATCEQNILTQADKHVENEKVACAERVSALREQLNDANDIINQNQDQIDSLLKENQIINNKYQKTIELEKSVVELSTKLEGYTTAIKDKERIITEQAARIESINAA